MRIQLRLSNQAKALLAEEKIEHLQQTDHTITYGYITNKIFKTLSEDITNERIDWNLVYHHEYFKGIVSDYKNISPTALNLDQQTLALLEATKKQLNGLLGVERTVYRSFVIRMVLKAHQLQKQGYSI